MAGLTKTAVVAWVFASRTRPVEVHLADAANIVFGDVPPPRRDRVPLCDSDLHVGLAVEQTNETWNEGQMPQPPA